MQHAIDSATALNIGLDGSERAALKARMALWELCSGGRINLKREGEQLWAEYGLQPAAVLKLVGNHGSGGRMCSLPTAQIRHRVK